MYQGQGKLLGYRTYKDKNGVNKHVYSVLVGTIDATTGLYDKSEYITITATEQTLKTLKPQDVSFEVTPYTFNGITRNSYSDIHAVGEVRK